MEHQGGTGPMSGQLLTTYRDKIRPKVQVQKLTFARQELAGWQVTEKEWEQIVRKDKKNNQNVNFE